AGGYEDLGLMYRSFSPASLVSSGSRLAFIGASPVQAAAVVVVDTETGAEEVVRRSLSKEVDPAIVSVAEPIEFPSTLDGEPVTAHALFYRPNNPGFSAPGGQRPPGAPWLQRRRVHDALRPHLPGPVLGRGQLLRRRRRRGTRQGHPQVRVPVPGLVDRAVPGGGRTVPAALTHPLHRPPVVPPH